MTLSVFYPTRQKGLLFHAASFLLLLAACGGLLYTAIQQGPGGYFALLILLSVLCFLPLPLLIYRAYALIKARYVLERDGLHLRWGLRAEDIPLTEIEWARPAADLPYRIPASRPSWPGALLGSVKTDDLGLVEYMASDRDHLLLVATSTKVFAISPSDMQGFQNALQAAFEMGSLTPIPASSVLPAEYASRVWAAPGARWLIVAGLLLALLLFIGVSLSIPGRASASLGFYPDGQALPPVPSAQLMLLPILGMFFYLIDLGLGLVFFRKQAYRPLAYLLWGGSLLTSLLFIIAAAFILL